VKRLAVYCGSASPEDPRYIQLAYDVGANTNLGAGIPGVSGSAKATV
jgi:phytoene dehydrogenase-like protein